MQRLREQTSSSDPTTARAAELLASREPLDVGRLRRRPVTAWDMRAAEMATRRPSPALRPTLVLAISLGSVVAAAATLERTRWWQERRPLVVSPLPAQTSGAREREAPAPPALPASALTPLAVPELPLADKPAPSARALASRASSAVSPRAAPNELTEPRAPDDESALIVTAVRALRRAHDPALALALSEQALQRYPHGTQAEEATALCMEAAFAAGERSTARRWAQRYLEVYRSGRFADPAQQILSALNR